jgi:hypothetical protein
VGEGVPHRLEGVPAALDGPKVLDRGQGPQVGGAKFRPASVAVRGQGLRAPVSSWFPRSGTTTHRPARAVTCSSTHRMSGPGRWSRPGTREPERGDFPLAAEQDKFNTETRRWG